MTSKSIDRETLREFLHEYIDRAVDSDNSHLDITRGVERDYDKEEATGYVAECWKRTDTWKLTLDWKEAE